MTREEYIHSNIGKTSAHRMYYGQYVTDFLRELVWKHFEMRLLLDRAPFHSPVFGGLCPLSEWDKCAAHVASQSLNIAMRANGDAITLCGLVCILKEAARQESLDIRAMLGAY